MTETDKDSQILLIKRKFMTNFEEIYSCDNSSFKVSKTHDSS